MKKVTLLLPDEVIAVGGNSRWSCSEALPTNRENVIKALTSNDYHLNHYFVDNEIEVLSIEDVREDVKVVAVSSLAEKQAQAALSSACS